MKPILLLPLILLACNIHAADNETITKKKVTHHVQFLIGNYVSESAMNKSLQNEKIVYTPFYSYSIGFDYKVEFAGRFGLRTGINYFTYGTSSTDILDFSRYSLHGAVYPSSASIQNRYFSSAILIPIHFLAYKPMKNGRLVMSAGPDIYLPTNSFGKEIGHNIDLTNGSGIYAFHSHSTGINFFKGGSLGFTAGIGYEKKFKHDTTVEFMPDFRVLNLVPFNFQRSIGGEAVPSYTVYTFSMALGLSTYITFY
jgi:hypothetical protein